MLETIAMLILVGWACFGAVMFMLMFIDFLNEKGTDRSPMAITVMALICGPVAWVLLAIFMAAGGLFDLYEYLTKKWQ